MNKPVQKKSKVLLIVLTLMIGASSFLAACDGGVALDLDVTEGEGGVNISGGISEGGETVTEAAANDPLLFLLLVVVFFGLVALVVSAGRRSE